MSVEDIVDGLAIIQQKRGRIVDQGDVEMLALAIKELRKGRPGTPRPEGTGASGYANGYATAIETAAQVCDEAASNLASNAQPGCAAHTRIIAADIRELMNEQSKPQKGDA